MSCYFYILCKYWKKHLRTALSLLFSGLLLTAIITSVFLFIREEINREVETGYDTFGKYDLILSGIPNDIKNELFPSDLTFTHETVTVPGKAGFYGFAHCGQQAAPVGKVAPPGGGDPGREQP